MHYIQIDVYFTFTQYDITRGSAVADYLIFNVYRRSPVTIQREGAGWMKRYSGGGTAYTLR